MPPYSKSIPRPTGSEHFTRYFIRALAVFGSAANHFLKWSSTSEFGRSPFRPRRFGGMPFMMPHAVGSMGGNVGARVGSSTNGSGGGGSPTGGAVASDQLRHASLSPTAIRPFSV